MRKVAWGFGSGLWGEGRSGGIFGGEASALLEEAMLGRQSWGGLYFSERIGCDT